MLNLPKQTEISKQLPKKAIFEKFSFTSAQKEKFNADISRITIVNEISPNTVNIAKGENVSAIYVLFVLLKTKNYSPNIITQLTKLIPQNMLLCLAYNEECRLALFHGKLIESDWQNTAECSVALQGLDLDRVWENFILQVGKITIKDGNTLDGQIAQNDRREQIEKQISVLQSKIRKEKQLNKQVELNNQIKKLKAEMENI